MTVIRIFIFFQLFPLWAKLSSTSFRIGLSAVARWWGRIGHFGDNDKLCELHHIFFCFSSLCSSFLFRSFEIQHHADRLFSRSKRNYLSSYIVVIDARAMRFPLREWSRESESAAEERASSRLYVFTLRTFYPG